MEQPSFLHKSGRAIMKTATSTKAGARCLCLGAPRDRACARRERWDRRSFRAAARGGIGCRRSYARSGPVPLRLTYLVGRSAGPGLRSQGTLGQVGLSRGRARGIQVSTFLRSLRPGPAPLDVFGGALRGTGPALAGNVGTGGAFALARDGDQDVDVPTLADGVGPTYLHKRGHSLLY